MNSKTVPLNAQRHGNVKVDSSIGYSHAQSMDITPIVLDEVERTIADYVITFTKDKESGQFRLVVLLGLGQSSNAYQNPHGWNATYIPKNISRYPFVLAQDPDTKDILLCIDEASPHLNKEKGHPLFDENGEPSVFHKQARQTLEQLMAEEAKTQSFIAALMQHDLLSPLELELNLSNEEKRGINGIYQINAERLNHLDEGTLATLHSQGFLKSIFTIEASKAQLSRLVQLHNANPNNQRIGNIEILQN